MDHLLTAEDELEQAWCELDAEWHRLLREATEEAIWNTIRSMQESSMLMTHLAEHWRRIDSGTSEELLRRARKVQARAELVRELASEHEAMSEEKVARNA